MGITKNISIAAAHFNHKLRTESDLEELAVRKLCTRLGVPLEVGIGRVSDYAAEAGCSIHVAARKLRHHFLAQTANDIKVKSERPVVIALGHQEDDALENLLMRLISGSGVEGLAWLESSSTSPADPSMRILRPLLDFQKRELELYCHEKDIDYSTDLTNHDLRYPRSRVRRGILPEIERLFGLSSRKGLRRSGELIGEAADWVSQSIERAFEESVTDRNESEVVIDYSQFSSYHSLLRLGVIRRAANLVALGETRISLERCRAADRAAKHSTRAIELGEGLSACRWEGALHVYLNQIDWESRPFSPDEGVIIPGFGLLKAEIITAAAAVIPPPPGILWLDYAAFMAAPATVRPARAGDRIIPFGARHSCSVLDLLREARIPPHRRLHPILEIGGVIAAIPPLRIADSFKLTSESKRAVKLSVKPAAPHINQDLQEFYDRPEPLQQGA